MSTPTTTAVTMDLEALLPSFQRYLGAANRSPRTRQSYAESVEQLARFLREAGMPQAVSSIRHEHVESFIEDLLTRYRPATAAVRFRSLQQFFRWALEDGEITESPMARMKMPHVPEDPPRVLSDDEVKALLKACEGNEFTDRRDAAIVRVFLDTGARLSEVADLMLDLVDMDDQTLTVTGKGSRVRVLPIGAKTVRAIDRYLRARRAHPFSAEPWLWIGGKGRVTPSGIAQMLRRRANTAGGRRCSPAHVPALVRPSVAGVRGPGGRPPRARGLAEPGDAPALWRVHARRASIGRPSTALAGRPAVRITVRCGVLDRGKPCGRKLGMIEREGFPGPLWFRDGNYDRLAWEERHYVCPKHGAMQVHEADLLHLALKPRRRVIVATSVEWIHHP